MSRQRLRRFIGRLDTTAPRANSGAGAALGTGEITETTWILLRLRGGDRGLQQPPWTSGAKKAANAQRRRRARLRGDLQCCWKTIHVGDGGLNSSQDGGRKPWVSRGGGPFSVNRQDSRCAVTITSGKLQRQLQGSVHRGPKQVSSKGRPRLPASQQGRVKRWPPVFECGIGCESFRQLARQGSRPRPNRAGHPSGAP